MTRQRLRIAVDQEVSLEAALTLPQAPRGAALVLHPHPLYGGSMDNNVVEALVTAAGRAGWAALAFNFRGVGGSSGRHDQGLGEQEDVLAAAHRLGELVPGPLALLGYSFGALVGSWSAPRLAGLAGGVWVAPALSLGALAPWPPDAGPLLVVAGDRDPHAPLVRLRDYVTGLGTLAKLFTLTGGDHFFQDGESVLIREVEAWLSALPTRV